MSFPPYHLDHVGSFLRSPELKAARIAFYEKKEISKEDLQKIEDIEIKKIIDHSVQYGYHSTTDGELRRLGWTGDFQCGFKNVEPFIVPEIPGIFSKTTIINFQIPTIRGKVEYDENHFYFENFTRFKALVPSGIVPKVTLPAPAQLISLLDQSLPEYYKGNNSAYFADIGLAYNKTLLKLYELGLRYVQLDNCAFNYAISLHHKAKTDEERAKAIALADYIAAMDNAALHDLPADLSVNLHICRGNYKSDYAVEGPYDPIAKQIASVNVNGYFLEFDDERSGGFGVILPAILNNGRPKVKVVLGLLTSKRPALEDEGAIIARIEEAAKLYPKELLCLSTQCGFASMAVGNILTEEEQWAKYEHVAKIAKKVWPDA